jgi:hypothetical protein
VLESKCEKQPRYPVTALELMLPHLVNLTSTNCLILKMDVC